MVSRRVNDRTFWPKKCPLQPKRLFVCFPLQNQLFWSFWFVTFFEKQFDSLATFGLCLRWKKKSWKKIECANRKMKETVTRWSSNVTNNVFSKLMIYSLHDCFCMLFTMNEAHKINKRFQNDEGSYFYCQIFLKVKLVILTCREKPQDLALLDVDIGRYKAQELRPRTSKDYM